MLRGIPLRLKKGKATVLKLVRYIEACIILHNIINGMNETDYETWIREDRRYNRDNGLVVHNEAMDAMSEDNVNNYQNSESEARDTT
jgi:hypothetical protein